MPGSAGPQTTQLLPSIAGTVPGARSAQCYLQCFARDPLGALQIGAAAVVTVQDPAF